MTHSHLKQNFLFVQNQSNKKIVKFYIHEVFSTYVYQKTQKYLLKWLNIQCWEGRHRIQW